MVPQTIGTDPNLYKSLIEKAAYLTFHNNNVRRFFKGLPHMTGPTWIPGFISHGFSSWARIERAELVVVRADVQWHVEKLMGKHRSHVKTIHNIVPIRIPPSIANMRLTA